MAQSEHVFTLNVNCDDALVEDGTLDRALESAIQSIADALWEFGFPHPYHVSVEGTYLINEWEGAE
jgi:hypothetical protein